jgi:quercetin dioxygenase-like cupin family protein
VDIAQDGKELAMKRAALMLGLGLAVGITVGTIGIRALNAQPEPVEETVLLKTDLKAIKSTRGMLVLAELAPGAATGNHDHPGDELAYVLEGSITLEVDGEAPVTFKPGDTFHQPRKRVHNVRNASRTAPAKVLIVLIEKKQKNEPKYVPMA